MTIFARRGWSNLNENREKVKTRKRKNTLRQLLNINAGRGRKIRLSVELRDENSHWNSGGGLFSSRISLKFNKICRNFTDINLENAAIATKKRPAARPFLKKQTLYFNWEKCWRFGEEEVRASRRRRLARIRKKVRGREIEIRGITEDVVGPKLYWRYANRKNMRYYTLSFNWGMLLINFDVFFVCLCLFCLSLSVFVCLCLSLSVLTLRR